MDKLNNDFAERGENMAVIGIGDPVAIVVFSFFYAK